MLKYTAAVLCLLALPAEAASTLLTPIANPFDLTRRPDGAIVIEDKIADTLTTVDPTTGALLFPACATPLGPAPVGVTLPPSNGAGGIMAPTNTRYNYTVEYSGNVFQVDPTTYNSLSPDGVTYFCRTVWFDSTSFAGTTALSSGARNIETSSQPWVGYILSNTSAVVYVQRINIFDGTLIGSSLPVRGRNARGLNVSPDSKTLYFTTENIGNTTGNAQGQLVAIDTRTFTTRVSYTVGYTPRYEIPTPDGNYVIVSNYGDGTVTRIDRSKPLGGGTTTSGLLDPSAPSASTCGVGPSTAAGTCSEPRRMASDGGNYVYVSLENSQKIAKVNVSTLAFSTVSTTGNVVGLTYDQATSTLFYLQTTGTTGLYKVPASDFGTP